MAEISGQFNLVQGSFILDASFTVPANGLTAIYGPSGSGKTTLLQCMAGLQKAKGRFSVASHIWQDSMAFIPAHKRSIGYVFQEPSLFPHLSVEGNLKFGLRNPSSQLGDIVDLLGIAHLMHRRPENLSGGEGQRVGLARALVLSPSLLLMDEPLSALDEPRKLEILPCLEKIKNELNTPIFYVTHSSREIFRLADYLIVMKDGKTTSCGPFSDSLLDPLAPLRPDQQVSAVISGTIGLIDHEWHLARLDFDGGYFWARYSGGAVGQQVRVSILARDVSLNCRKPEQSSIQNVLSGVVDRVVDDQHPGLALVRLKIGSAKIWASVTRRALHDLGVKADSPVWIQVKSVALLE